jgi:hypothetical protein
MLESTIIITLHFVSCGVLEEGQLPSNVRPAPASMEASGSYGQLALFVGSA